MDEYVAKIEKSGGKIVAPKMTVPRWGWDIQRPAWIPGIIVSVSGGENKNAK